MSSEGSASEASAGPSETRRMTTNGSAHAMRLLQPKPKSSTFVMLHQLRALMWKEFILRTKAPIGFVFEFVMIFGLILLTSLIAQGGGADGGGGSGDSGPKVHHNITYYPDEFSLVDSLKIPFFRPIVYYCPNDTSTIAFMNKVSQLYKSYSGSESITLIGFKSEEDLLFQVQKDGSSNDTKHVVGGLILTKTSGHLQYTIRPSDKTGIETTKTFALNASTEPVYPQIDRYAFGVIQLHFLVNEAFMRIKAETLKLTLPKTKDIQLHYHPYPAYDESSQNNSLLLKFLSPFLIYGLIYFFNCVVRRITVEKQNGSREMFNMMGLSDGVYWFSIFLGNYIVATIGLLITESIIFGVWNDFIFYAHSNKLIVFFILNLYVINVILNGCLLSIPFNRPVLAQIVSMVFFSFSFSIPNSYSIKGSPTHLFYSATSWLPNTNLDYTLKIINLYEGMGIGVHWNNLMSPSIEVGGLSVGGLMSTLIIEVFLNMFLIFYLDKVWPWQSGIVQSPWFLFTVNYWSPKHNIKPADKEGKQPDPKYFEEEDSLDEAVRLSNVTKKYGWSNPKAVVDNITFSIYRDQITCLLGHNGAGKTTTMSMITGVFPPTRGKINVNGYDLLTQTGQARRSMSLCPQHNPLYDIMTVTEHLMLYAAIKGHPWGDLRQEVKRTIEAVTLVGQETKKAKQLSGGMKRKLCLGIALIGGSEVIILDEPTSGLDTEARRSIWDALRNIRKNKTILLSTHDMEEADALGDRIIIMASGILLCAGSTQFLRKAYDAGYTLKIAKSDLFNQDQVEQLLRRFFPNFRLKAQIGSEISFNLRNEDGKKAPLPDFFRELQAQKDAMGIESFGLSVTTMEDIFLKAGDKHEGKTSMQVIDSDNDPSRALELEKQIVRATGSSLNQCRVYGLLVKRFHFTRRYLPILFTQVIIPGLFLAYGFYINNSLMKFNDQPNMKLELGKVYGDSNVFITTNDIPSLESKLNPFCSGSLMSGPNCHPKVLPNGIDVTEHFDDLSTNQSLADYLSKNIIGLEVSQEKSDRTYHAWVTYEATHSDPMAIDMIYKMMDMEMTKQGESTIETSIQPLPSPENFNMKYLITIAMDAAWLFYLPLVFPPLASSFILYPIHENVSKAKLVQLMTGLHPFLYHLTHFIFDNLINLAGSFLLVIVILLMDVNHFFSGSLPIIIAIILLLVMFGIATIPFAYLFSLMFSERISGYSALNGIYIITGLVTSIILWALNLLSIADDPLVLPSTVKFWEWFARLSPIYSVSKGFRTIYKNGAMGEVCASFKPEILQILCGKANNPIPACCPENCYNNRTQTNECIVYGFGLGWSDNQIGKDLFMLGVTGIGCLLLLTAFEKGIMNYIWYLIPWGGQPLSVIPEVDVDREKARVDQMIQNNATDEDALITHYLMKKFRSKYVVNGITFGVHKGEIFGLLGVNGAGKTTTFSMITGDLVPTSGDTYQGLQAISANRSQFQQHLGYCPQFDPLLDKLTGREMLFLFGRLRGVGDIDLPIIVNQIVDFIDLRPHVDKRTETYSGGNKRKLSLGLALIGRPKVLLLDEPTAGVDPGARRKIWNTLNEAKNKFNCSVVLTSHSMDECEALCSRVAIMVAGQFRCLGSSQHLKSTYGQGYTITIKFDRKNLSDPEYTTKVDERVINTIPGVYIADQHERVIVYRTKDSSTPWDKLFSIMDSINDEFQFEDYTISDTTLEQIFIAFARNKQDDHTTT